MKCPLCESCNSKFFIKDLNRNYQICSVCSLIFVPPQYFLTPTDEKKVYDQHQNSPADLGYRKFLSKLMIPLDKMIKRKSFGLDFGSGSGPTLSVMMEENGHKVNIYDKYYSPDESVFKENYDFITSTEVFEHLAFPKRELERLLEILKKTGVLGLMTKLAKDKKAFLTWHYKNDLTHISFFSKETFIWLAKKYHLELQIIGSDVIIFRKN